MNCSKCGTEYEDSFKFCPYCKEPNPNKEQFVPKPQAVEQELTGGQQPVQTPLTQASGKSSRSKWIIVGVIALLVIVGVTLGLVFGLSGGGSDVTGTYFNSKAGLTMVLGKDGVATIKSSKTSENITGSYVIKDNTIKIWDPSKGSAETLKGFQLKITGETLVDDGGDVWNKTDNTEKSTSSETTSKTTEDFTPTKYVWENNSSGDGMTFNADGTWNEVQNGVPTNSGTYTVVGDTVNMTFHLDATSMSNAVTTTWPLTIEGNRLIDPKDNKNLVKE